jgi:hypothetical protein
MTVLDDATFEDYLGMKFEEDRVTETYIDPLSLKGAPKVASGHSEEVRSSEHSCSQPVTAPARLSQHIMHALCTSGMTHMWVCL